MHNNNYYYYYKKNSGKGRRMWQPQNLNVFVIFSKFTKFYLISCVLNTDLAVIYHVCRAVSDNCSDFSCFKTVEWTLVIPANIDRYLPRWLPFGLYYCFEEILIAANFHGVLRS